MSWLDIDEGGGVLKIDDPSSPGSNLELEVIVDPEEGLAWGLWWKDENHLLAVFAASCP